MVPETKCRNPRLRQLLTVCGIFVIMYVMLYLSQDLISYTSVYVEEQNMTNNYPEFLQQRDQVVYLNQSYSGYVQNFNQSFPGALNNTRIAIIDNHTQNVPVLTATTNIKKTPKAVKKPKAPKHKKPIVFPKVKKKPPSTISPQVKSNLAKFTKVESLKKYSAVLYERSKAAVAKIKTTTTPHKVANSAKVKYVHQNTKALGSFRFDPDLTICKAEATGETKLILFTTMFHSESKQYLFNNTITNYALLKPVILPVLYITEMDIVEKSGNLIHRACELGLTVAIAPLRTVFGFPILNTMYFYALNLYTEVPWVGYANADILFTRRLPLVLDHVQSKPEMSTFSFMSSRRTNCYIKPGEQLYTLQQTEALSKRKDSKLHSAVAIDLFFYRRNSPLFEQMPDFCIGRRGYDNWLIFYQIYHNITSLDVTAASPAIHIGVAGLTFKQNSHRSVSEEKDYNMHLAIGPFWGSAGQTNCLDTQLIFNTTTKTTGQDLPINGVLSAKKQSTCPVQWKNGKFEPKNKSKAKAKAKKTKR